MTRTRPFNIWVYNRADGRTTFGEYIRGKRHVFWEGRSAGDNVIIGKLSLHFGANSRPFNFCGEPLPTGWLETFLKYLPARMFVIKQSTRSGDVTPVPPNQPLDVTKHVS